MTHPASVRWHEVTALYGGVFDPPHLGHRLAVSGLFSEPGIARVLVMPSASPPHKPTVASVEDRIAMTRLNFGSSPTCPLRGPVEVELSEIERGKRDPSRPTYSFETLLELRRHIPSLAFVVGTDQLLKLHTWHRFPEVLGLCHWIVLDRKMRAGQPASAQDRAEARRVLAQWEASGLLRHEGHGFRVRTERAAASSGHAPPAGFLQIFQTPAPAVSSTSIREALARDGKAPEGVLLPEVQAYLMQRGIYGSSALSKTHSGVTQ